MADGTKIHVGAGTLLLNPDTDAYDCGFCSEGATLTYNAELEPIEVDQILAPVGYFVPGEECKFETILSEVSATKLKYALGYGTVTTVAAGAAQKGYDKIEFGGNTVLTDYVLEYAAPKRSNRDLYIRVRLLKVNISPNLEVVFKKDGTTGFKLTAMAVADTTQVAGKQLGYYMEETAEFTGDTPTLVVSSVTPVDGAVGQATSVNFVATFNRAVHPESITTGHFTMTKADGTGVACTVTRTTSTTVTMDPVAALDGASTYVVVVSKDVQALDDRSTMAINQYYNFATT